MPDRISTKDSTSTTSAETQYSNLIREAAYVDGKWLGAEKSFTVCNPANGKIIATVPDFGAEETRLAITAAHSALPLWKQKTAHERAKLLRRWHSLIIEHSENLSSLLTAEQGKPLGEARGEIGYAASFVEWFAEESKRLYGDIIPAPNSGQKILVERQAIGVCAAITPWNFPCAMITRKVAPALAAGCTVVLKPAEATPLSALALAVLADEAGIPAGVFNVITTNQPAAVGDELCKNPLVRKLSFTGSTAVGKLLMEKCAPTVKKLSLELGGNAPFIIFEDADLDVAVKSAIASKFRNSGQTCVCANRFLVQDTVYEAFTLRLTEAVKQLKCGDGFAADTTQGPLINEEAVNKVEKHVKDALKKGAKVVTGGRRQSTDNTYFEPTVLTEATPDMKIAQEETFGPVAALFRFKNENEAISLANDTESGLASYLFTKDLARAIRVSAALEYGIVGVNEGIISNEVAPFGGVKTSGLGREGSKYGIEEFTELKYILLGGLS